MDGAQARMWALGKCFTTWAGWGGGGKGSKHSVGSSCGLQGEGRGRHEVVTQAGLVWHLPPFAEGASDSKGKV